MIIPIEKKALNAFEYVAIGTPKEQFEKFGYSQSRNLYTTTEDEFAMDVNTADYATKVGAIDTGLKMEARRVRTERLREQEAIAKQKATKEANADNAENNAE